MTATATKTTKPAEPQELCDVSKVAVGSQFSRRSFGEVLQIEDKVINGTPIKIFKLRNSHGLEWTIDNVILAREFAFADQCDNADKVEKLSRTKLIEVLKDSPRTAMTVTFHKKVDKKAVAKSLSEGQGKLSARAWNKVVREALAGEECVIVGYHTLSFDDHQRLRFIKIGGEGFGSGKPAFRLVDPRTVTSVIVNRTKYVVK